MRWPTIGRLSALLVIVGSAALGATQAASGRLDEANALRAAGALDEALVRVTAIAADDPADTAAARLRLELLLETGQYESALAAYDQYVAASGRPDPALLALVAVNELEKHADQPTEVLGVAALERLARFGEADARETLVEQATTLRYAGADTAGVFQALSRLGDEQAATVLGGALVASVSSQEKLVALEAIRLGEARGAAAQVLPLLDDGDPLVRLGAARALGVLGAASAQSRLQDVFDNDPVGTVKLFAAIALKRLGASSADEFLAGYLANEAAEPRLRVADAYSADDAAEWVPRIRGLATAPNPQHRIQAATLLACCDVPTALSILRTAAASPNPLERREAAQALESTGIGDALLVRQLLGDTDVGVRLWGAGAALDLAEATDARR